MKVEICQFSGFRIHPGHGKKYVRADHKQFFFITKKAERQFKNKNNPRKIAWTTVFRKMHKKGIVEDTRKKRSRKTQKATRAIVGASLAFINEKRNQAVVHKSAETSKAAKAAREKRKAAKAAKLKEKKAAKKNQPKQAAPAAAKGRSHAGKGR